jgi:hypothetical protein
MTLSLREKISNYLNENGESVILMDGFDEALIGFSQRINEPLLAVYSWEKMIDLCIKRDKMEYEEAVDYVQYNCISAWIGDETPVIVMPLELE